jgi:1,4-dihydroxy-2-naphthoyl-CoA hydrolase
MAIWFDGFPLEQARSLGRDTLIAHLGIELLEAGHDFLKARMPVDPRTRQPAGVLHGGASVTLAETLASWAATYCVDRSKNHCVGLEINANHVRPVREGYVYGVARPIHLGRSTHIWEIRITTEDGKLVCISRVTMAVLDTPDRYTSNR